MNEMRTLSQGAARDTGRSGHETQCVCQGVNEGSGAVLSSPVARATSGN